MASTEQPPLSVEAAVTTTSNPVQISQEQATTATGTQVAVGNSGNNVIVTEQPAQGGTAQGADVATGGATAVGSDDENVITQGADVVLTEQAVANLLQIALIINIGVALANSGLNTIDTAPGGSGSAGAIGTGNATATGLDIDQYITQAAREAADADTDAEATQLAISLWMGLAVANSGANAIAGTGVSGSGGAIGSGDATATGNDSLSSIDQYAALFGSDQSTLNVTQRSTVLDLGFALANSGLNDISGVAGGLLSADPADDDAMTQELFAMLLPALLQNYGYGPAQGTIGSGDATATGNESQTFTKQVALAAASGDGIVDITQDVLVANMGVAGANTGLNTLGSVRTLDPDTARAVVTMAAFLAQLLAMIHQSASSTVLSAQSAGIEVPFGNLILRLDGVFNGLDTQLTQGDAQANIRQVSLVISLGIADANTGGNATVSRTTQGNTVNAVAIGDVTQINSGDADAGNAGLVVICQRINADDIECLAPPTTTIPPPAPTTTVPNGETTTTVAVESAGGGAVPTTTIGPITPSGLRAPSVQASSPGSATPLVATGSNISTILIAASLLIILGGFLVMLRRRNVTDLNT